MYIRFYDPAGEPFRSFNFLDLEFKDFGVKITDKKGFCHMVMFSEFSYFVVVNK